MKLTTRIRFPNCCSLFRLGCSFGQMGHLGRSAEAGPAHSAAAETIWKSWKPRPDDEVKKSAFPSGSAEELQSRSDWLPLFVSSFHKRLRTELLDYQSAVSPPDENVGPFGLCSVWETDMDGSQRKAQCSSCELLFIRGGEVDQMYICQNNQLVFIPEALSLVYTSDEADIRRTSVSL